ncbi:MAG: alpha/beta fold hydrolase [Gemmatimonadota bacterium]
MKSSFTLEPRPGDVIRGDVRLPDPGTEADGVPRAAVLVVHGFKGFKDWAFFPYTADRLAAAGHAVVSFNFSRNGVGKDLVSFSELDKFGANTLSLELDELHLVLDRIFDEALLGFAPERVGVLGHSRGGGSAIIAASEDDRVDALVTWAAIASFDRWTEDTKAEWRREGRIWIPNLRTRQQMPLDVALLEDFEANQERLDIVAAARRLERPWLVVHGTGDDTVDPADGRKLVTAGPRASGHWVEGAGHTFEARHPFEALPPELDDALEATLAHFDQTLRG